ncbi:glucokinase [Sphingomonas japonica]|uniref:Glucokinase n=1 Tax=Sphingomonas japonica TaxID=511662 RepID=A0ABX0U1D4_9SPHN|nr:glucokinase [Sphingomonas japonica]NIJ23172.1 glucokinase [Sphingomonas japonica]
MTGIALGLVADIGRVSVRFGLTGGTSGIAPSDVQSFNASDHPSFTSALIAYLTAVGLRDATLPSVLAVAGAARGDVINLTGSRWYISLAGVEAVLRAKPVALNECAASALALTLLGPSDFLPLPGPPPRPIAAGGNYLVVAPGTGLGIAALLTQGGRLVPIQSEAGHMMLAARGAEENRLVEALTRRGTVASVEALLSASGLVSAYAALAETPAPGLAPEDVTRNASRDPAAAAALGMFIDQLGSVIGDLVLAFGAWDGVFLTGSIARAIRPRIAGTGFRERLEAKAAFRRQLCDVPVSVVGRSQLELLGAAVALSGA